MPPVIHEEANNTSRLQQVEVLYPSNVAARRSRLMLRPDQKSVRWMMDFGGEVL